MKISRHNQSFGTLTFKNEVKPFLKDTITLLEERDREFVKTAGKIIKRMPDNELVITEAINPIKERLNSYFPDLDPRELNFTLYRNTPEHHCIKMELGEDIVSAFRNAILFDMQLCEAQEYNAIQAGKSYEEISQAVEKRNKLYEPLLDFAEYIMQ